MTRRSFLPDAASLACAFLLWCQPATAQSLDSFFADLRTSMHAVVQESLSAVSDELIASTIRDEDRRNQLVGSLFETNLDPSATPMWTKALAWESGRLLSSPSLLAMWQSKKELVSSVLKTLAPEERQTLHARIIATQRALDDYRFDRMGIRAAFREQKDAYSLCEGKHDASIQTLKNASYRLSRLVEALGDEPGPLSFADRLWNAGGYELLGVALTIGSDLAATLTDTQPIRESSLAPALPAAGGLR